MADNQSSGSVLSVHLGKVLMHLSGVYPRLLDAILEMIQNSIDGGATRIYLEMELATKKRWATIADNGVGISPAKFSDALKTVGESQKHDPGSLGQFGLGLISPLGKVTKYRIASCPDGQPTIEWVFNPRKIEEMSDDVTIPYSKLARLPDVSASWGECRDWRTVIRLEGINTDRTTSWITMSELATKVATQFGEPMRQRGILVKVKLTDTQGEVHEQVIEPLRFTGVPFDEVTYKSADAGDVTFRLFRAVSSAGQKPKGKVGLRAGGDLYTVPWNDFARQARGRGYGGSWLDALASGFFEGDIEAEKVKLAPERTKFEWGDPLVGMYACMESWYEEVGKPYLDAAAQEHKSERLQQLGSESMKRLEEWIKSNPFFAEAMKDRFLFGETGEDKPTDDEDGKPGTTGKGGGGEGGDTGGGNPPKPKDPPDIPKPPAGTNGPGGKNIKPDKGPPKTLVIVHEPLDSPNLWELDLGLGKLYFNTSHKLWAKCEPKDGWVLKLQDFVLMQVLHLLMQPEDLFLALRGFADTELCFYIEQFIVEGR